MRGQPKKELVFFRTVGVLVCDICALVYVGVVAIVEPRPKEREPSRWRRKKEVCSPADGGGWCFWFEFDFCCGSCGVEKLPILIVYCMHVDIHVRASFFSPPQTTKTDAL